MNRKLRSWVAAASVALVLASPACTSRAQDKAGEVAGKVAEETGEAWQKIRNVEKTFTISSKRFDDSLYHLVASDGTDYVLKLVAEVNAPEGIDPNREAYMAIKPRQVITVWSAQNLLNSKRQQIFRIVR